MQEEFLGEGSRGEKYMGEKYVQEERLGGRLCTSKVGRLCTSDVGRSVARYFCVILSLYLCNMILLVAFSLHIITQLITVCFFSSDLCVGFLFLGLYSVPSPSPPALLLLSLNFTQVVSHNANNSSHTTPPPLTTYITHLTQLISHNSSHTTHLTQLISLNSSHTTQLTQELLSCGIWWSCFRVLSLNFTQVLSHNSSHNSHNSYHTTPPRPCPRLCSRCSASDDRRSRVQCFCAFCV